MNAKKEKYKCWDTSRSFYIHLIDSNIPTVMQSAKNKYKNQFYVCLNLETVFQLQDDKYNFIFCKIFSFLLFIFMLCGKIMCFL